MKWFFDLKISTKILAGHIIAAIFTVIAGVLGIYFFKNFEAANLGLNEAGMATALILLTAAVGIIFAVGLGIMASRSIIKQFEKVSELADKAAAENIKEKTAAVEKIASGDLTFQLKLQSNRDMLGISINSLIDTLRKLVAEADAFTASALDGNLEHRGDAEKFSGVYNGIIKNYNKTIDALAEPINISSEYIEKISKGNIPGKITTAAKGGFNKITDNINNCIDSINSLIEDTEMLSSQVMQGDLSARATSEKHTGDFAKIVKYFNSTLDSVIGPLNVAASHIEQIGRGEIPEKITEEYKGEFNDLKNSINSCIDGLGGLVEGKYILRRMSFNDYSVKMEGAYSGIFGEMSESISMVSDRILHLLKVLNEISAGDLNALVELKSIGKRSEKDTLMPTIIEMMENIKALVDETSMLSKEAIEGKLAIRGNAEKFNGEYAKVIQGINNTLDAVIEPVREAFEVLQEMAKGNLQVTMVGNYQGDHAAIKSAMNETVENIRSYLNEISDVLIQICNSNLDLAITADYKGDFIEIKDSLNHIILSLSQVMTDFGNAAEQVSSGSRQVSEGSQTLAQGSTEQASSIQELTASISEIAEQSKDNAVKANEVYELAKGARDGGAKGNLTMNEMLESMKDINESSVNISKIIKVIDDIAFQTNILALNAAVEAARAGSHGKGFAVVAEEVRNLAGRSAKAAEETTELIKGSIQKVQAGTRITNEIAAVLQDIAEGAVISTEKLSIIAEASNKQASGISQINQGIEEISRVIQSNSATAEQSAAASEELSGQAELLKEMVSKFNVSGRLTNIGLLSHNGYQYEQDKAFLTFSETDKY